MTHTITAQDGSGDFTTPFTIEEWAADSESGNVVTPLLAPGAIAVTLVGDLPRTGVLKLSYVTDSEAEEARTLLGRAAAFALASTTRPVVDMTFARVGRMSATARSVVGLWVFEVGFQETP